MSRPSGMRAAWLLVLLLACIVHCGSAPQSARMAPSADLSSLLGAEGSANKERRALPISLTASDGTGLRLKSLRAQAVLEEPLAYTEVHLAFENVHPRTLEGRFEIALPVGAAVSRFAMKIGGAWQEAEMVETARARQVYETFLHRKQDPALLERAAANVFSARVFPIPANAVKEILVGYAEEIAPGTGYVLGLTGLPALEDLDVVVRQQGEERHVLKRKQLGGAALTEDVVVAPQALRVSDGVRSGRFVLARVRPTVDVATDSFAGGTLLLVDTSASRALGFSDEIAIVREVAGDIAQSGGADARLVVAAFDQEIAPIYDGAAAGFDGRASSKLYGRSALGASNLEGALGWAARMRGIRRVIVIGDGVATVGTSDGSTLAAMARTLRDGGVERLDAVVVGGIRDVDALARITRGVLARDGVVVDGRDPRRMLRLTRATTSGLAVKIEGASWVWPERLDGVLPGDERLVYAEVPARVPVQVGVGTESLRPAALRVVDNPLLEHAWARAKIASTLARAKGEDDPEVRTHVVQLSTQHRVLSPYTSFLVLETENDYRTFGIDRRAPLLAIRDTRVVLESRAAPPVAVVAQPEPVPAPAPRRPVVLAERKRRPPPPPPPPPPRRSPTLSPPQPAEMPMLTPPASQPKSLQDGMQGASGASPAPKPPTSIHQQDPWGAPPARRIEPDVKPPPDARPFPSSGASRVSDSNASTAVGPYDGRFGEVMNLLSRGETARALDTAMGWRRDDLGDVMALVALGEALEAHGDVRAAARSYGSIIDLYPGRADMRRLAGERIERLRTPGALDIAIDTYGKAAKDRPDHPSSHRLLAFARLRRGDFAGAFAAARAGLTQEYPNGRFASALRILSEDLGLIAAAWIRAEPQKKADIMAKLYEVGGAVENGPSLRFVLLWETDASDIDFHITDTQGGHAYWGNPRLESGGELYADVRTGFGPECFTVRAPRNRRLGPYRLQAHYYAQGPTGYGMGKLEIIDHDGQGNLTFEERPFVLMTNSESVDLGTADL